MPLGPGKYDDLCTYVREQAKAKAAIVIIVDGDKGMGFSVQTTTPDVLLKLPDMLKHLAKTVAQAIPVDAAAQEEKDLQEITHQAAQKMFEVMDKEEEQQ